MANERYIDIPREIQVLGIGQVVITAQLPAPFDLNKVTGQIIIVARDYTVKPQLANFRLELGGRIWGINDVANLPIYTEVVPGGATGLLALKDTDVGFAVDSVYDQSSNQFRIVFNVNANGGLTGFWLYTRPILTITPLARKMTQVLSNIPAVIKDIKKNLPGQSVSATVSFEALREEAK
jgi:hypothetical protein